MIKLNSSGVSSTKIPMRNLTRIISITHEQFKSMSKCRTWCITIMGYKDSQFYEQELNSVHF